MGKKIIWALVALLVLFLITYAAMKSGIKDGQEEKEWHGPMGMTSSPANK